MQKMCVFSKKKHFFCEFLKKSCTYNIYFVTLRAELEIIPNFAI